MRYTVHERYNEACQQAEAELGMNVPAVAAVRRMGPHPWNWFYGYKLTELHDWCLAHMPRVILELGSGWTTFVFARYAAEFGARLITVEESDKWRDEGAMKILPDWAKVEWHMSPSVIDGNTIHYRDLPALEEIDLVYVDGPATEAMGKDYPCSDAVLLVESGAKVKNILVDIRTSSVDLMRDRIGDRYGFEPGGSYKWAKPWYLRPMRHHSWFWRK